MVQRRRAGITRQYTDDEKGIALALLRINHNYHETGRLTDIPPATIRRWAFGEGCHPAVMMSVEDRQKLIADRLETIIHRLLDIVPDKETDATLQQTMTSVAIAIDKMRLMREQPTQITQREQGVSANELLERLRAALPNAQGNSGAPLAPGLQGPAKQIPGPTGSSQPAQPARE